MTEKTTDKPWAVRSHDVALDKEYIQWILFRYSHWMVYIPAFPPKSEHSASHVSRRYLYEYE